MIKTAQLFFALIVSLFSLSTFAMPIPYADLPPGSYLKTCQQCRVNQEGRLTCMCQDRQQVLTKTSLALDESCGYIENIDGALQCSQAQASYQPWQPQPWQPPYPYHRHHHRANTFVVQAGPIWNQSDASFKCPNICGMNNANWTGSWTTTDTAAMSICKCVSRFF